MTAKEKADKYFSEYIRLRDADQNGYVHCFTCGVYKNWKEVDCGHYMSRRHEATRYDERNARAQCKHCNQYKGGDIDYYAYYLDQLEEGLSEKLKVKAQKLYKRLKADYLYIAEYYRNQVRYLKKEKGL